MKAYWAAETDEWGFYVHGATPGQARSRALRCEPSGFWAYLEINVTRVPKMDGQPFTFERLVAAGITLMDMENGGEMIESADYVNLCDCELCAAAAQEPVDKVCQLFATFYESSRCVPYDPDQNQRDYQAWVQAHLALSPSDQRKAENCSIQVMQGSIERITELLNKISNGKHRFVLNEKPCGECAQFKPNEPEWFSGKAGICLKKIMGVTRTMLASCPVGESCFEAVGMDGTEARKVAREDAAVEGS